MKNRTLMFLMVMVMIFSLLQGKALAKDFPDMPNDWSATALKSAVANGLLTGTNGKLMPGENMTRAQMAVIINRAFGASEKASLSGYTDVPSGAWYYEDMARAVQMKTFVGSGARLNPDRNISREEAFVVLAKAFRLSGTGESSLDRFSDAAQISSWARDGIASLVKAGYVSGFNGRLNPRQYITRAEIAQIMFRLLPGYIRTAGTYTEIPPGNLMINAPEVILKDVTVTGDLIIGDGVGRGNVTLENVKVTGLTVVRGGGINSIKILGTSKIGTVIIAKVHGSVRVVALNGSSVETIYIDDGKDEVIVEGTIGSLQVAVPKVNVVLQNAQVNNISVAVPNASLNIGSSVTVKNLSVLKGAPGSTIIAGQGAVINRLSTDAPNTAVGGSGTVKNAVINGDNSAINTVGTILVVGQNVQGTTSGGQNIAGGTTGTTASGGGVSVTPPSTGGPSTVAVSSVAVSPTSLNLRAGGATGLIIAGVTPDNATNKDIVWSSSDEAVATVVNGVVTPISEGNATITAASSMYPGKTAVCTVTVTAAEPGPFTPGEGGNIPQFPAFAAEPGKFGFLYVLSNHNGYIEESYYELMLQYSTSLDGTTTLQYSGDGGQTWQNYREGENDMTGDLRLGGFNIYPDGAYWYRLIASDGPFQGYTSNVVKVAPPEISTYHYGGMIYFENDTISVGTTLEAYVETYHYEEGIYYPSIIDVTEFTSVQWYRVNPVTFEMSPIGGTTGLTYTTTDADIGYWLLFRAVSDGQHGDGFMQGLAQSFSNSPVPVVIPNQAYVTNVTRDGFTLNLYKGVDKLSVEDLYLEGDDGEITIDSVSPRGSNAVYYIAAEMPMNFGVLWMENNSRYWRLTPSVEAYYDYGLEISNPALVRISIAGGTVFPGSGAPGFHFDLTEGKEEITVAPGTDTDSFYQFMIYRNETRTLETLRVVYSGETYEWVLQRTAVALQVFDEIGTGSAAQVQSVPGFVLDNEHTIVKVDETIPGIHDKTFYFDVIGGANNGKRFRVYYDLYWRAEQVSGIVTSLEITGADSLEVKLSGDTAATYSAVVLDQNDAVMAEEGVLWSLKNPVTGISINAVTGQVTLADTTMATEFTIVAASATDNSKNAEKVVALTKEKRTGKAILDTTLGVVLDGNIDAVPAQTKVSALKAALTVSQGAVAEILAGSGGTPVVDQENIDVTDEMVVEVTAEDGTKTEYTINMAT